MSKKQVVVVTGASAGLGRAIAHAFAKRGAHIGLIARNPEALEAARQEVMGNHNGVASERYMAGPCLAHKSE